MKQLDDVIKLNKDTDESYIKSITKKYNDFIKYSDLPNAYYNHNIDIKTLPARYKTLYDNIYTIINEQLCLAFNVKGYHDIGYISSLLLDTYFKLSMENDTPLESVIYVDTNLLLDDYKKLMDIGINNDLSLAHSEDTLLRHIENATYVIWDKFSYVKTEYDRNKLYNILLVRYRKGLGNMFFIKDAKNALSKFCDEEMFDILDIENIVSLENEQIKFSNKEEKGNIKW